MKMTQWLLFIISLLLVGANLRMLGEESSTASLSQEICIRVDNQKPACFKKLQAAQQFLTMLKYRAHEKLPKISKKTPPRRFGLKNSVYKSKNYLLALNKMQDMVQRYIDMAQQKPQESAVQVPTITIEPEVNTLDMPESVPVIIESVEPLCERQLDDTVKTSLEQLSKKIDDLYADRQKDAYMNAKRSISPDMGGMQYNNYQPQMASPMQYPMVIQQPMLMQPYQYPNQMQTNAQAAQMAMQLQSSAMMMQQQASALLMQAQQQVYMPQSVMQFSMQPSQKVNSIPLGLTGNCFNQTVPITHKEKLQKLMDYLREIMNANRHEIAKLIALLDLEFDIIEHLLNNSLGSIVERAVNLRNETVRHSDPLVVATYNLIVDLATYSTKDETDVCLYRHYLRKSKKNTPVPALSSKKQFLIKMLTSLEHYYDMVENMQGLMSDA